MVLNIPDRDDWFVESNGFPRPQWPAIAEWVEASLPEADFAEAWPRIVDNWLRRVRRPLGGKYTVVESQNFHLLSELDAGEQHRTLQFLETARARILHLLGHEVLAGGFGKHVVLRFSAVDDYYKYIAEFFPEGETATSGGMLLNVGYPHIALPGTPPAADGKKMDRSDEMGQRRREEQTLAHELTHGLLVPFPLPMWLNEALAMLFEADLSGARRDDLTDDLMEEHEKYWNEQSIQDFWRGKSFYDPEGQRASYSLARIFFSIIRQEVRPHPDNLRRFITESDYRDAGAAAARAHLGIELGDVAATFLGEGTWGPMVTETPGESA